PPRRRRPEPPAPPLRPHPPGRRLPRPGQRAERAVRVHRRGVRVPDRLGAPHVTIHPGTPRVIRSMTGFGEASAQSGGAHYFVEVRSLNSKYFKAAIRLPEALQGLEAEMETALRRRVHRGTVTLTGSCADTSEAAAFEVNHLALQRYVEQIRKAPVVA